MLSVLLCTGLLLAAADQDAANSELADQVARLVRQLDARELSARDGAERELLELGAPVLPLLPEIGDDTPAEVALRVTRVQQELLEAEASAAAEPALVTLEGTDMPLSDVLEAMSRQTGNHIVDYRDALGEAKTEVRLKVDFDKVPFWKALDAVLDQAELSLYPYSGERGAFVVNRPPGAGPRSNRASYAAIFRIEPVRFEAARDLRNANVSSLRLYLEATWEPRLQPFAILQPLDEISAVGDSGETLKIARQRAMPEATIRTGMSNVELEVPLALPDRGTKKIRTLKGKFLALVPGPAEDFRFPSPPVSKRNAPAKRLEQRKAGATVTIDRVRQNNAVWEVSLRVKFDAPSTALESHRGWILDNEAYFVDADGHRTEPGGFEQSRQAKDEIGIRYFFDLEESPDKLEFVYRTPITILEMTVDYEFHDLLLP